MEQIFSDFSTAGYIWVLQLRMVSGPDALLWTKSLRYRQSCKKGRSREGNKTQEREVDVFYLPREREIWPHLTVLVSLNASQTYVLTQFRP
jgi:hypothetical protein